MNTTKSFTILLLISLHSMLFAQNNETKKINEKFIRDVYTEALTRGHAYEDLRFLCKEIGARITGSTEAQMAIEWGQKK